MLDSTKLAQLSEILPAAQSILIVVQPEPSLDQVAAGIALTEGLRHAGKEAHLLIPSDPTPTEYPVLLGTNIIEHKVGNRDLLISFDYRPELVDKVSYHIDEEQQKFCLVVKPQKGQKPLDPTTVEYSYSGAEADLIFLIGIHDLETLGELYFGYEQLFKDTTLVTFHTFEPEIGTLKLDASGTSSFSESMMLLLQALNLAVTPDTATNLLSAIEEATQHFQSLNAGPTTFAMVSELLRAGGRRINRSSPNAAIGTSRSSIAAPTLVNPQRVIRATNGQRNGNRKPKSQNKPTEAIGSLHYQPSNLDTSARS